MINTIFENINDSHKSGLKSDFQKSLPSLETNLTLLFSKDRPSGPMLSISRNVRLSVRLCVRLSVCSLLRYRLTVFLPPLPEVGCPIFLEIRWTKNTSQINVPIWLIFQTLSLISQNFYVVYHQPYAWLESYDRYSSFATMIKGSLIVTLVLWLLSSRNTLSVTHSDTASYSSGFPRQPILNGKR